MLNLLVNNWLVCSIFSVEFCFKVLCIVYVYFFLKCFFRVSLFGKFLFIIRNLLRYFFWFFTLIFWGIFLCYYKFGMCIGVGVGWFYFYFGYCCRIMVIFLFFFGYYVCIWLIDLVILFCSYFELIFKRNCVKY